MCGRYTYKLTWEEIVALYRLTLPDEPPEGLRESFNVAPAHQMPIIRPAGNWRDRSVEPGPVLVKARAGRKALLLDDQCAGRQDRPARLVARPESAGEVVVRSHQLVDGAPEQGATKINRGWNCCSSVAGTSNELIW